MSAGTLMSAKAACLPAGRRGCAWLALQGALAISRPGHPSHPSHLTSAHLSSPQPGAGGVPASQLSSPWSSALTRCPRSLSARSLLPAHACVCSAARALSAASIEKPPQVRISGGPACLDTVPQVTIGCPTRCPEGRRFHYRASDLEADFSPQQALAKRHVPLIKQLAAREVEDADPMISRGCVLPEACARSRLIACGWGRSCSYLRICGAGGPKSGQKH